MKTKWTTSGTRAREYMDTKERNQNFIKKIKAHYKKTESKLTNIEESSV